MHKYFAILMLCAGVFSGCGGSQPTTQPSPAASATPATVTASVPAMRSFAPVKIGPYDVQPMFEEEIENGHYNFRATGGEVKALRVWVGSEDHAGVMVVKTEIENDYLHGHIEVPNPLPADAKLWMEIENPAGETFKGSTPLVMVP